MRCLLVKDQNSLKRSMRTFLVKMIREKGLELANDFDGRWQLVLPLNLFFGNVGSPLD